MTPVLTACLLKDCLKVVLVREPIQASRLGLSGQFSHESYFRTFWCQTWPIMDVPKFSINNYIQNIIKIIKSDILCILPTVKSQIRISNCEFTFQVWRWSFHVPLVASFGPSLGSVNTLKLDTHHFNFSRFHFTQVGILWAWKKRRQFCSHLAASRCSFQIFRISFVLCPF